MESENEIKVKNIEINLQRIFSAPYDGNMTLAIEQNIEELRTIIDQIQNSQDRELPKKILQVISATCTTCSKLPPEKYPNYLILLLKAAEWLNIFDENAAFEYYDLAFQIAKNMSADEFYAEQFTINGDAWDNEIETYNPMRIKRECYRFAYQLSTDPLNKLIRLQKLLGVLYDFTFRVSFGFDDLSAEENKAEFKNVIDELAARYEEFTNLLLKHPPTVEIITIVYNAAKSCYENYSSLEWQDSLGYVDPDKELMTMLKSHFENYIAKAFELCQDFPAYILDLQLQVLTLLTNHGHLKDEFNKKEILKYLELICTNGLARKDEIATTINQAALHCLPQDLELAKVLHQKALDICQSIQIRVFIQFEFINAISKIKSVNINILTSLIEQVLTTLARHPEVDIGQLSIKTVSSLIVFLASNNQHKVASDLFNYINTLAIVSNDIRILINMMKFALTQEPLDFIIIHAYGAALAAAIGNSNAPYDERHLITDLENVFQTMLTGKVGQYANAAAQILLQRHLECKFDLDLVHQPWPSLHAIKVICHNLLASLSSPTFVPQVHWSDVELLFKIVEPYLVTKSSYKSHFEIRSVIFVNLLLFYSKIKSPYQEQCEELLKNLKEKKVLISDEIFKEFISIHTQISTAISQENNQVNVKTLQGFSTETMVEEFQNLQIEELAMELTKNLAELTPETEVQKNVKKRSAKEEEEQLSKKNKSKASARLKPHFDPVLTKDRQNQSNTNDSATNTETMVAEFTHFQQETQSSGSTQQILTSFGFDPNDYEESHTDEHQEKSDKEEESDDDEGFIFGNQNTKTTEASKTLKNKQEREIGLVEKAFTPDSKGGNNFLMEEVQKTLWRSKL